jgi:glycine/D-amino acid oxidase-like deaminating enzyme
VKEYAYWLDTIQRSAGASRPDPPSQCDVAIVGAGYTGLSAARYLARAGASVVVLERERIGWGASSRNGGQVLTGLKLDAATLVARYGERRARDYFAAATSAIGLLERLIADEAIDCGYRRSGHLQGACKRSHFDDFRAEQALLARVFDHRVHLLSREQQHSEIGSGAYHGVMVDEQSAAINPAQYVQGLAGAACRSGAVVCEGEAARRIEREGGGRRFAVETTKRRIAARDVLVATNGYSDGAWPALQRRVVPIGSYIIATEPLTAAQADHVLPRRRMAFDSKNFLFYFRLTDDRRLLFGGRAEFGNPDEASARRAASTLRRGIAAIFPDLADLRIEYAWGGAVAFTRDQLPHAGVLDGIHYAVGYAGHGIAMATSLGEQIARRIAGEAVTHPLVDSRLPAIPLYRGTPWFLPLVGVYYQVKDWLL